MNENVLHAVKLKFGIQDGGGVVATGSWQMEVATAAALMPQLHSIPI
jgi:hypothetical protein